MLTSAGDAAGQQTCDSYVAGSSPGWAALRITLKQATYTCAVWFGTGQGDDLFGWESNHGPGGKWLPRNWDQLRAQRS